MQIKREEESESPEGLVVLGSSNRHGKRKGLWEAKSNVNPCFLAISPAFSKGGDKDERAASRMLLLV